MLSTSVYEFSYLIGLAFVNCFLFPSLDGNWLVKLQTSIVQEKCNMSHIDNLKFSSTHIKKVRRE